MKTTTGKTLIYDNQCPMCTAYSSAFVKSGLLGKEGRIGFNELGDQDFICRLDMERAGREIPLVDLETGEIIYGIDALISIIGARFPVLGKCLNSKLLYYPLKKLYAFVSLNRRIIVPPSKGKGGLDFPPPFNHSSRTSLLVFGVLFSVIISALFGISSGHYLHLEGVWWKMIVAVGSGWGLQLSMSTLLIRDEQKRMDYAATLGVLMIIGVLILIPSLFIGHFTSYHYPVVPLISVLISSGVMLYQHVKRVKFLGLSQLFTVSWFLCLQLTALISIWIFYLNRQS
jgi:hypothetical protein